MAQLKLTKKLYLVFHGRLPGEKAAAVFTAKSAEAFADTGLEVVVLAPRRLGRSHETVQKYFGVKNNFKTVYLPIIDLFSLPFLKRFAFIKSYVTFSISVFFYLLFRARREDIIYSNEPLPLFVALVLRQRIFFEVHDFPRKTFFNRWFLSRVSGVISTNRWKADELAKRFNIPRDKILFEPNAVDAVRFADAQGAEVRQKLPFTTDTVLIGYAGTLKTMGMEKGIRTLLGAIAVLPTRFKCLIIGGLNDDIEGYTKEAEKLKIRDRTVFAGWMHYTSVPEYLAACDVLVAPFPKTEHYDHYMSPMKLFEYMAVGKPIVASRLRAIEEVVGDDSAYLVEPDDPKSLAVGIEEALSDPKVREKVIKAREIIAEHTWIKRAWRIRDFVQK